MNTSPALLLRDFSDRLSPMVVKELRHGLRTRVFASVLTTFQLCMILIVSSGVLGVPAEVVGNIFWTIALTALLLALPVRGFSALSGEVQGGTMDMLTLTSISSFRIVWGKWTAMFSQSLLLAVSLLPYMVARYYFGGVEIVRESVALFLAVLASAITSAAFVAFSSQKSIILRLFLTAGILASLTPVTFFIFVMINESGGDQVLREFLSLSLLERTGIAVGLPLLVIYGIFTLLALGASRIAPASENHSTWKRIMHLVVIGLLTLTGLGLSFHPETEAAFWAFIPALFLTVFIGIDVMTEEMPRFPTVVQTFVKRGPAARLAGRVLYPGWASGTFLYAILLASAYSILVANALQHPRSNFGETLCGFFCVLVSAAVPVCLPVNRTNRFANWWVVHVSLAVAGTLLVILMNLSDTALGYLGTITPMTTIFASIDNYRHDEHILMTGAGFAVFWLLAAMALAGRESEIYKGLETEADRLSAQETCPLSGES